MNLAGIVVMTSADLFVWAIFVAVVLFVLLLAASAWRKP